MSKDKAEWKGHLTSGSIDEVFNFLDEHFDSHTGFLQLLLVSMKVFSKVRAVSEALSELQRQEPHYEAVCKSVLETTETGKTLDQVDDNNKI